MNADKAKRIELAASKYKRFCSIRVHPRSSAFIRVHPR
jgi:hypothetical protein